MAKRNSTVANSTATISMSGRPLPHEIGDTALQLDQLQRLHQYALTRDLRQPSPGQLGNVTRQKQYALGERRPLFQQALIEFRAVHAGHPQIGHEFYERLKEWPALAE